MLNNKIRKSLVGIKLLILDVDGVLTDGKIYLSNDGIESKCFNVQDGLGLKLLLDAGLDIAVISGRRSKATQKRLRELNIKRAYFGVADKTVIVKRLKKALRLNAAQIACVGDDLPDLRVMQEVGFGFAVANAVPQVRQGAQYVTMRSGGDGAVREVCEVILEAKGSGKG